MVNIFWIVLGAVLIIIVAAYLILKRKLNKIRGEAKKKGEGWAS